MDDVDVNSTSSPHNTQDVGRSISSWSSAVSDAERVHHPHLLRTLSKWSTKIQVATPNFALGFKSSKTSLGQTPDIANAIQDILEAHGEELLTRTRSMPSSKGGGVSPDPDVFNDADFYQQLLRDIIDSKAGTPGGEEQTWLQRQTKTKRGRTVDTKASKGRKLRYEVHEKMQHFMIPITVIAGGWPDEQVDELFCSLVSG